MGTEHKVASLPALLLSLILGVLGIILLLSTLGRGGIVFASQEGNMVVHSTCKVLGLLGSRATTTITNRVDPPDADTGDVVTITFVVAGLGVESVDVVLVQDISGSMLETGTPSGQTRLDLVKAAAITFVEEMADVDRVAIVAYSTTARLVLPLTLDTDASVSAIHSLEAQMDSRTNIGDSIQAGYEELINSARYHPRTVKAMVLLSDGSANMPPEDPEFHALHWAEAVGKRGITIYTIGFGQEVNDTLMQDIAYLSGGEYYRLPDGTDLGKIYQEIALGLRNFTIMEILPPGVDLDCALLPSDWQCIRSEGFTSITIPINNSEFLAGDCLTRSFKATVNLDPGYKGPIIAAGSAICWDGPGGRTCHSLANPSMSLGGRKVTGVIFEDLDRNGRFDADENVLSDVVVTTSDGLTSETDISGIYLFRTSAEPTLTVAVSVPIHYTTTTIAAIDIPPVSGTYLSDFGLYPTIEAISLNMVYIEPSPDLHGDSATLHYSIVNKNQHSDITSGTVQIVDSLNRTLDQKGFDLEPGGTIALSSPYFTVPRDTTITLTAVATYEISGGLSVSDHAVAILTSCPTDVYEIDNSARDATLLYPNHPQLHDFSQPGDKDWAGVRVQSGDRSLYTFTARPLAPDGVPISLTLHWTDTPLSTSNLNDPRSPVQISKILSCAAADGCGYFLQTQSPESGCWTDYELWVERTDWDEELDVVDKDSLPTTTAVLTQGSSLDEAGPAAAGAGGLVIHRWALTILGILVGGLALVAVGYAWWQPRQVLKMLLQILVSPGAVYRLLYGGGCRLLETRLLGMLSRALEPVDSTASEAIFAFLKLRQSQKENRKRALENWTRAMQQREAAHPSDLGGTLLSLQNILAALRETTIHEIGQSDFAARRSGDSIILSYEGEELDLEASLLATRAASSLLRLDNTTSMLRAYVVEAGPRKGRPVLDQASRALEQIERQTARLSDPESIALRLTAIHWLDLLRQERKRRRLEVSSSAYIVGRPITEPNLFFGRDEEMRRILSAVQNDSVMIYGPRRIGKTTVLHQLDAQLRSQPIAGCWFVPVFANLQAVSENDLFSTLVEATHRQVAQNSFDIPHLRLNNDRSTQYTYLDCQLDLGVIIQTIKNRWSDFEIRLVWLLDEVDKLLGNNQLRQVELRTVGQAPSVSRYLRFVLAGVRPLRDLEDYGSPFYNIFTNVELGPLSTEDATKLIASPVQGQYEYRGDAISLIIRGSNAEPYWIQYLCREILTMAVAQERRQIVAQDVQAALRNMPPEFPHR